MILARSLPRQSACKPQDCRIRLGRQGRRRSRASLDGTHGLPSLNAMHARKRGASMPNAVVARAHAEGRGRLVSNVVGIVRTRPAQAQGDSGIRTQYPVELLISICLPPQGGRRRLHRRPAPVEHGDARVCARPSRASASRRPGRCVVRGQFWLMHRRRAVAIVSLRALPFSASAVRTGAAWQVGQFLL